MGVDELKLMNDLHRIEQKRTTQRILDEVDHMQKERTELCKRSGSQSERVSCLVHAN